MLPEALALARGLELPWLEIFLRHWGLQSRVLHREQGEPALAEAVSLLEFAHRPETAECPQSVCVVQDLAACYGAVDGPGYAQERIAVCTETLARITPHWPCFVCISDQMAQALVHAGRIEEAKRFYDQQRARLKEIGKVPPFAMLAGRVDVLLRLGEIEAAREALEEADANDSLSENQRVELAIARVRVLARLGRVKEALEILPNFDRIAGTPSHYPYWTDAVHALIKQGALAADAPWSRTLRSLADKLRRQGAYGGAYDILIEAVARALERGRPATAAIDLESAEKVALKLRRPERARTRLAELHREVTAAQLVASTESLASPEAIIASLDDQQQDFELALERVVAGRQRWPDHNELLLHEARCLTALGANAAAIDRLLVLKTKEPANAQVLRFLGEIYLREQRADELIAWAETVKASDPTLAHWFLARLDYSEGRDALCIEHLQEVLKSVPDAINARKLWVQAARRLGDFHGMKERLTELIALEPAEQQHHWGRMVAATIDGDWEQVRQSATSVGMKIEGIGPIDLEGELIRVRFTDDDGQAYVRHAVHNGPATARIVESRVPPPNHFRDVVVFDPAPLDRPEQTPERQAPIRLYAFVATLSRGQYRIFSIDGVHPGKPAWDALRAGMSEIGCDLQRQSGDDYQLRDPDTGMAHPAIFAALAIPERRSVAEVHHLLQNLTAEFALPLTWTYCAAAASDDSAARRHQALLKRWEGQE